MKTLNLVQGSQEWNEERARNFTASEAPVMKAASTKMRRDELLSMKKYAIERDVSDYVQKNLFDRGHEYEAAICPVVEKLIGQDLYPATGVEEVDGVKLLASFDGITMMENVIFEHKMLNKELAEDVNNKDLKPEYYWQLEQQLLVSGADKAIFVVSDGTEENMVYMWYEPVPGRAEKLITGWKQFIEDMDIHKHIEDAVVVAEVQETLPAVSIRVDGGLTIIDNLSAFGQALTVYVEKINKEPETDQDFVNLEAAVKTLSKSEEALTFAENNALSQAESIDIMRQSVETYRALARKTRLIIEKLVTAKKATIKSEIVEGGKTALFNHVNSLDQSLDQRIGDNASGLMPVIEHNFASVIKNKRTLASIRGAVNDELARCKILANEAAEIIRANLKVLADNEEHKLLFSDIKQIVNKEPDDFKLLVNSRITAYKEQEATKKAEKEKIKEKPQTTGGLSESSQGFVNEMDGVDVQEPKAAIKKLTKAEEKKLASDIKKLKAYFTKLTSYAVPELNDPKCVAIAKKAVEKLIEMQDYVESQYPEKKK